MKNEEIIRAIAELDGREIAYGEFVNIRQRESDGEPEIIGHEPLPPYLTSRDAIVPIREKLVNTQVLKDKWLEMAVMVVLETEKEVDEYALTHLTAEQECKTLLLLFKKWN